jgi:hypothetical protein
MLEMWGSRLHFQKNMALLLITSEFTKSSFRKHMTFHLKLGAVNLNWATPRVLVGSMATEATPQRSSDVNPGIIARP